MSVLDELQNTSQIGSAKTISLQDEERDSTGVIEQATADGMRADIWFRGGMVLVVAMLFVGLNASVMLFIRSAFEQDLIAMVAKPPLAPGDRLVTTGVLMALIGATVIQTGIGFIAIVSYLFPKR